MKIITPLSLSFLLYTILAMNSMAMEMILPRMSPILDQEDENNNNMTNDQASLDWDSIDKTFQDGIITLAEEYNLEAYSLKWYKSDQIIPFCAQTTKKVLDPVLYRQESIHYNQIPVHPPLPGGAYARPNDCPPWIQLRKEIKASRAQGLKIHVSAKPETALKIAKIALPILREKDVHFKIMYDLPLMRGLYYLSHYDNINYLVGDSKSSQAGKFIALYPSSLEEGRDIIAALDTAFKNHGLSPNDFVPLAGDAQIGDTGGIFARYGKFSSRSHKNRPSDNITPVDAMDQSIPLFMLKQFMPDYNPQVGLKDERIFPWPDYMNNRDLYDHPLFGDLKVTWVNPYQPDQIITWDTRPNCWAELKGGKCLK